MASLGILNDDRLDGLVSSLLQPRYLQEVLGALRPDKMSLFIVLCWLIGVALVGLSEVGHVCSLHCSRSVFDPGRRFRKIRLFYANIEQFNAGNLVVRKDQHDINQIQNVVMIFKFLSNPLFIGSFILAVHTSVTLVGDCPHGAPTFALTAIMMG